MGKLKSVPDAVRSTRGIKAWPVCVPCRIKTFQFLKTYYILTLALYHFYIKTHTESLAGLICQGINYKNGKQKEGGRQVNIYKITTQDVEILKGQKI